MTGFFQQVYAVTAKIPQGKVATYGDIARQIGTRDARRVGQALHANRDLKVPCHRVIFANGSLAPGYAFPSKGRSASGRGGQDIQRQKLEVEGAIFKQNGKVDLDKCRTRSLAG